MSRAGDYLRTLLTDPIALRGQQLRGSGPVAEFEQLLAERCGFPYCLATTNATAALTVAALAAGLNGRSVLADLGAWMGSLGALEVAGARLEIGALDGGFEQFPLERGPFAAILASDQPGKRHDARHIRALCDQNSLLYLEDTDRLPGITCPDNDFSLADVQILSFGPGKPLSLGEGGALLTRDISLFRQTMVLSQHPERLARIGVIASRRPLMNGRIHPLSALLGSYLLSADTPPWPSARMACA